jgi:hypothetical protein
MQELIAKAEILLDALPYIRRYSGKTMVIKYGVSLICRHGGRAVGLSGKDGAWWQSERGGNEVESPNSEIENRRCEVLISQLSTVNRQW